jgi:hypothetical protein
MSAEKRRQKRRFIIAYALALLSAGTPPDALPGLLMDEYGLTRAQARAFAAAALREHKAGREAK